MIEKWDQVLRKPLLIAGIVFLIAYATPIIWPEIPNGIHDMCTWTQTIIWMVYLVDYVVSLCLTPTKFQWFKGNLFNLLAVILPMVRPLRAIRALVALALATKQTGGANKQRSFLVSVSTTAFATWLVAGLAITDAERGMPGANIQSVIDGWWWSISTLTTVGYGDAYPVTTTGRLVGIAVMASGIALFGTLTAGIASYFVSLFENDQQETMSALTEDRELLESILIEIRQLKEPRNID